MTDRVRIRIAALVIAIFIGGLSIAGLAARHQGPAAAQPAQVQAQTQARSQAAPATTTFRDDEAELDED